MKEGSKLVLILIICCLIFTACQKTEPSSPPVIQPSPAQSLPEPDFSAQSWLEAWHNLQQKWGISGEAYVQSLNFRTEGEKLTGLNLVIWAEKEGKWSVYRYNREENYRPSAPVPLQVNPDYHKVVEAERFFSKMEPFPVQEFGYPQAETGYTTLIIKPEEGMVLSADAGNELYLLRAGAKTSPVTGGSMIVDSRQVLLQSNPVGPTLASYKQRTYLLQAFSGPVETTMQKREANTAKAQVYGYRLADLNGDYLREELTLWGLKTKASDSIPGRWQIVIKQGEVKTDMSLALKNAYQGVGLTVRDLTNDGKPEVIIEEYAGGSGNVTYLHVYQVENSRLKSLFTSEAFGKLDGVANSYLGNNRVRVTIKPLKLSWEYELAISGYQTADKLSEKQVQEKFSPDWVDPFSAYELTDLNGDGWVEIVGSQVVCGLAHAENVGMVKEIFAYDGERFGRQGIELYRYVDYGEERVTPK